MGAILWERQRSCLRKRKYTEAWKAWAIVRRIKREHPSDADGLMAYRCRFCRLWHVGHKPGTRRERWASGRED